MPWSCQKMSPGPQWVKLCEKFPWFSQFQPHRAPMFTNLSGLWITILKDDKGVRRKKIKQWWLFLEALPVQFRFPFYISLVATREEKPHFYFWKKKWNESTMSTLIRTEWFSALQPHWDWWIFTAPRTAVPLSSGKTYTCYVVILLYTIYCIYHLLQVLLFPFVPGTRDMCLPHTGPLKPDASSLWLN